MWLDPIRKYLFYFTVLFFFSFFFCELVLVQAGVCNADAEAPKCPDMLHVQFYEDGISSGLVFLQVQLFLLDFFVCFFFLELIVAAQWSRLRIQNVASAL